MKALTVRPPWSWAIAAGHKLVENRSTGARHWSPQLDLVIHAGGTWSYRGAGDERVKAAWCDVHGLELVANLRPDTPGVDARAFVAVVDLVDVHPESGCCEPWGEASYAHADGSEIQQVTHLLFENVRSLQPVTWRRGWLGLWTIPSDGERLVREQLGC